VKSDARKVKGEGEEYIVGEKSYIAYGVRIGNRVKINAFVYICNAVTIEDGVMISAGTIFTNDRFPRAATSDLKRLRNSDPDEHTLPTLVCEGATIGAGCVIGNDLTIGRLPWWAWARSSRSSCRIFISCSVIRRSPWAAFAAAGKCCCASMKMKVLNTKKPHALRVDCNMRSRIVWSSN